MKSKEKVISVVIFAVIIGIAIFIWSILNNNEKLPDTDISNIKSIDILVNTGAPDGITTGTLNEEAVKEVLAWIDEMKVGPKVEKEVMVGGNVVYTITENNGDEYKIEVHGNQVHINGTAYYYWNSEDNFVVNDVEKHIQ